MWPPGSLPAEIKEESEQKKVKRILLMVAYNILLVPYYWCKLCYYASHVEKYTEEERYKLLRFIDNRAITGGRIHIEVHGEENIPKKNGFMFFPNHQGLFDVLAIIQACPTPFFSCYEKGDPEYTVSETGFRMYESFCHRQRRCETVYAGDHSGD